MHMATKLIRLKEGPLVEVEITDEQAVPCAGGATELVEESVDQIKPILKTVCRPISEAWKEISQDMTIESAEVQLGLSFEGEGNLFISKAKAGANLTVKLTMKPKADPPPPGGKNKG
jgi:hypothetical protein